MESCSLWKLLGHVRLFATPWTLKSMRFYRPEYWSVSPFPSQGDLPNPGIEPRSPALQADSLPAELLTLKEYVSLIFWKFLKKYLCILGLCWVLLLLRLLSSCGRQELLSGCGVQASHCCGLFCCRARSVRHKLNSCGTQA